jgi:hypothetical protein
MAPYQFLIDQLPTQLGVRFLELQRRAVAPRPDQDIEAAFVASEEAYRLLVDAQPPLHRYHKGWPLHNMGMIRLYQGRLGEAQNYVLDAFVEDALSRGEESPGKFDETARPAALNLVFLFDVPGRVVVDLARRLRLRQAEGRFYPEPRAALLDEPLEQPLSGPAAEAAATLEAPPSSRESEWRRVAEFGVPWEDRVFVGGSYLHNFSTIRIIRDEVRRNGLDGVLVAEFKTPSGMSTRNKSLTLLRGCRRAIFEFSAAGGQLVEFDQLLNNETEKALVVFNEATEDPVRISAMTRSLYGRVDVTETGYSDVADLRRIVEEWLRT